MSNKIIDLIRMYLPFREADYTFDTDALFVGKKHFRLHRSQVYRLINAACAEVCPNINVGTHTMRKTFGYHHYQKFKDIVLLQRILNHSAPSITLRYIGITQDLINESYKSFDLFDEKTKAVDIESETKIINAVRNYLNNNGIRHRDFCEYLLSFARI